jgi:hypothetical protein
MCQVCILLDREWPGPKNLVAAIYEVSPSGTHIEEIINRVSKDLDENELSNLAGELMREALKMSP